MTKQNNNYLDGHCAGFNGWKSDETRGGYAQCQYDRGYWDGCKARERALERKVEPLQSLAMAAKRKNFDIAGRGL